MMTMRLKKKTQQEERIQRLKKEFYETVEKINNLDNTFNNVDDPKLIEACIYERKALSLRAERLLNLAAEEQ